MSDGHYRTLEGQHGAFMVYRGEGYYTEKRSMIKIYLPIGNPDLEKQVADKLYDIQKEKYWPIDGNTYISTRARIIKHPLTKKNMVELAAETSIPAKESLEWIAANTYDVVVESEDMDLGKEGWSVGPCVFRKTTENNWGPLPGLYAKVRFNKMSIPFYVSNDKKTWNRDITKATVQRDRAIRIVMDSVMAFLDKNEAEILSRVADRPFNKSGIAEYEAPDVSFFVKAGAKYNLMFHQGTSNKVDQSKLANPDYKPIVTLKYRKLYGDDAYKDVIVAVIDDKFYEVTKYTTPQNSWQSWSDNKVSFKESDVIELNSGDEYVRERALRALASKL